MNVSIGTFWELKKQPEKSVFLYRKQHYNKELEDDSDKESSFVLSESILDEFDPWLEAIHGSG